VQDELVDVAGVEGDEVVVELRRNRSISASVSGRSITWLIGKLG
jgi:hypothetical protein